uniref:macrosialin n=1 Tax=Panthera onca TaxID=9690 RepID=UPI0029539F57|nr:macrosialin [Panthera onca]
MRLVVVFSGALLGLLVAQGTVNSCPHKKSATLLPSFTVTPTATESTARPATTSHRTTTAGATSHEPTTATHHTVTTPSHGNATVHPTTNNSTATSPRAPTSAPHPGPPPPPPSPSPGSKGAVGDYTWTNGSQPCVRLQGQIQIGILYPTQGGGKAWGISVLNPNKTKAQGDCEGAQTHLLLSFPYGQLSFGFKQEPQQSAVYLSYVALEYNVSLPQAAQESSSPVPLLPYERHLPSTLFPPVPSTAATPPCPPLRPGFPCPTDQFLLLPLVIGLVSLGLLALVLATFCIVRRRPPTYQPL